MQPARGFSAPSGGWAQTQASQVFFQQSIKYLGHIISQERVQADSSKIEKVVTWPNSNSTMQGGAEILWFRELLSQVYSEFCRAITPVN